MMKIWYERFASYESTPVAPSVLTTSFSTSIFQDHQFTTEFGRTPFAQSAADQVGPGRDHNRYGFSCWMAGAGLKPGIAFGSTDEIGWKAVERPIPWHDFHATVLHLFGIDHEQLTYYHNGIQRRLTNVHGEVLDEILA